MLNKLNGWQRLWVVFSVFLFLLLAFYAYLNFPREFSLKSPDGALNLDPPECESIIHQFDEEWRKTYKREPDVFDLAAFSYADPKYVACRDKAKLKQQEIFAAKVFLVWLTSIIFSYGVGFSIAWVRSGFRHRKENDK